MIRKQNAFSVVFSTEGHVVGLCWAKSKPKGSPALNQSTMIVSFDSRLESNKEEVEEEKIMDGEFDCSRHFFDVPKNGYFADHFAVTI